MLSRVKSKVLSKLHISSGGADLRFHGPHSDTRLMPDHGYGASASHRVSVYSPDFAGTHCTYPRRDGQAELTWVAGNIPG